MAKKNEAKIKFTAETGDFNKGIAKANSTLTKLGAELKLNEAQMKANGESVEGLEQKHDLLTSQLEAAQSKTEALANKLDVAKRCFGENSREVDKLETQLANARTAEVKLQKAVDACEDELNDNSKALEKVRKATDKAKKGFDQMKKGASNIGKAFSGLTKTIGSAAKKITTAFAGMGTALAGAAVLCAESTREYRTQMGKLSVAFTDLNWSTESATETYRGFYGVLGDQDRAVEASQLLASLATSEQSLGEWTTIATGIYAKFGDSLPVEGLIEACNETKNTGKITGSLADALNWAGISEEAFQAKLDKCTSASEREALIRNTLNGLYTDAATQYREVNGDIIASNEAQARLTAAMATFGEKIEPILTAIKNGFARVLEVFGELVTNVDTSTIETAISGAFSWFIDTAVPAIKSGIQWVIDNKDTFAAFFSSVGQVVSAAFNWLVQNALPVITSAIQWVIDNKEIVLALVAGIGAGFLAWNVATIVSGAITAIMGFAQAIKVAGGAFQALNMVMNANPIVLIITIIAALVAAFIALWNNCEGFRNFWIGLWEGIKNVCSAAWEAVKGAFVAAWNWIKGIFEGIIGFVRDNWQGLLLLIVNPFMGAFKLLYDNCEGFRNFIDNLWVKIKEVAVNVWNGIKDFFANMWNGIKTTAVNAWNGIKNSISNAWKNIKSKVSEGVQNVKNKVSTAWNNVKQWTSEKWNNIKTTVSNAWANMRAKAQSEPNSIAGFTVRAWDNLKAKTSASWNAIKNFIKNPIESAKNLVKNAIDKIKGFFSFKITWPKIPMPHFGVTPEGWKFGDLLKGVIPKLGIEWYAEGGIMTRPTVFGVNGNSLMAGGEAGAEAILPISKLEGYIADAVERHMSVVNLESLAHSIEELASRPIELKINGRQFALATASDGDSVNGLRSTFKSRGLVLD